MFLMNLLNWPGEVERPDRGPLELSQGASHYRLNGPWETELRTVLVDRNPILSGQGGRVAWVVVSHRWPYFRWIGLIYLGAVMMMRRDE